MSVIRCKGTISFLICVLLAGGAVGRAWSAGDFRKTGPGALHPPSELKEKRKNWYEIAVILELAPRVYDELRRGKSFRDVYKAYGSHRSWSARFDEMVFLQDVLLIPIDEDAYVKFSGAGWEEIDLLDGRELIRQYTYQNRQGVIERPLAGLPQEQVRRIVFNTDPEVDLGDFIIQSMLVGGLLERFPRAEIVVVNRYPGLWKHIPRVTAVADEKELYGQNINDVDLVIDFNQRSRDWFYDGNRNKVVCVDSLKDRYQFIDNDRKANYVIGDVPLYRYAFADYNYYDFYRRFSEALGIGAQNAAKPLIVVTEDEKEALKALLRKSGVGCFDRAGAEVILVNPFSKGDGKELRAENLLRTIGMVLAHASPGAVILIERGNEKTHEVFIKDLENLLSLSADIDRSRVNIVPVQLSYRDLAVLISLSDLVVGPDTATAHIAQAFDKDTVTYFLKQPEMFIRYMHHFEWAPLRAKSLTAQLQVTLLPDSAASAWLPHVDLEPMSVSMDVLNCMRAGTFGDMCSAGTFSEELAADAAAVFADCSQAPRAADPRGAQSIWKKDGRRSAVNAFVAGLKEPFRTYYANDLSMLDAYAHDRQKGWGFSGYVASSNIGKLFGAIRQRLIETLGAPQRRDVDTEMSGMGRVMAGA
jgi:ADP-heptose:LPS heptosyltransferase